MADITFVNNTLIPGTTFNPGLEDVLDRNGTLSGETATGLTITNDSGGVFDGFRFELKGTNFAFTNGVPTAGTITSITVKAPTGTTQIIEVAAGAGGFGNTNLKTFFDGLKAANGGVFSALDNLLSASDVVTGSALADHLTVFGAGAHTLLGNGGNDVLSARSSATLIGGTGNDTIQVSEGRGYVVAGADLNGLGGAGERNTLEIRGESDDFVSVSFNSIHDIDALRFVDTKPPTGANVAAAELDVDFLTRQIGAGQVSLTLAVNGSSPASPHSGNDISIFRAFDPKDTSPVNLDLSGWTFTNWDQNRNGVFIGTNDAVALNDRIVGTSVADFIHTNAGNDSAAAVAPTISTGAKATIRSSTAGTRRRQAKSSSRATFPVTPISTRSWCWPTTISPGSASWVSISSCSAERRPQPSAKASSTVSRGVSSR